MANEIEGDGFNIYREGDKIVIQGVDIDGVRIQDPGDQPRAIEASRADLADLPAEPDNVPAGQTALYVDRSDGNLYRKPSGGSASQVGGGGGGAKFTSLSSTGTQTLATGNTAEVNYDTIDNDHYGLAALDNNTIDVEEGNAHLKWSFVAYTVNSGAISENGWVAIENEQTAPAENNGAVGGAVQSIVTGTSRGGATTVGTVDFVNESGATLGMIAGLTAIQIPLA